MDGNLTVTKASLVRLLDGVLYPTPDDLGDSSNLWGLMVPSVR